MKPAVGNACLFFQQAIFRRDVANSEHITPQKWAKRPFMDRVKETAAVNFSELL